MSEEELQEILTHTKELLSRLTCVTTNLLCAELSTYDKEKRIRIRQMVAEAGNLMWQVKTEKSCIEFKLKCLTEYRIKPPHSYGKGIRRITGKYEKEVTRLEATVFRLGQAEEKV